MRNNNMIIMIVVAIIVAIAAFFGGMQYEKSKSPTMSMNGYAQNRAGFNGGQNGAGGGRFGRGGAGGGATVGQIVSADSNSITVKLADGSSKIVNISSSTKVSKTETASTSDLTTGTTVAAFGTANSDGSITATTVQVNPQTMMRRSSGTPTPTQ